MTAFHSSNLFLFLFSRRVFLCFVAFSCLAACAQEEELPRGNAERVDALVGAWGGPSVFRNQLVEAVVLFTPTHQVAAWFDASTGVLVHSNGGLWSRTDNHVSETVEFDTDRPERVGTDVSFDIALLDDSLSIVGSDSWLIRIDHGDENTLAGGWELKEVDSGDSLTASSSGIKIVRMMSSSRFQEIEYEPETGVVLSVVGGSYRIGEEGYEETIRFSTFEEAVYDQSLQFGLEREGETWRQVGAGDLERVWQRR